MRHFLYLQSGGLNPSSLKKSAYAAAKETWLCTGCAAPKPSVGAVDVRIQARPDDAPLTLVFGCGVLLGRRDLLEAFRPECVAADLMLGTVKGWSGELLSDWVTVRGRHPLLVRGSEHVSYRKCQVCGRHAYFALGERYLYPAPASSASIYEDYDSSLVVADGAISDQEAFESWPMLRVKKLKVLEKPRDGLGELP